MKPSVGRIVHYVSYGTPGGEYKSECRAAIITEVSGLANSHSECVSLAVLNPTGAFFDRDVCYDEGAEQPGDPNCRDKVTHGGPFRFCPCGWTEAKKQGGTWHWPERVDG